MKVEHTLKVSEVRIDAAGPTTVSGIDGKGVFLLLREPLGSTEMVDRVGRGWRMRVSIELVPPGQESAREG